MKRIIYLLAISCFLLISCHDDDRFSVENVSVDGFTYEFDPNTMSIVFDKEFDNAIYSEWTVEMKGKSYMILTHHGIWDAGHGLTHEDTYSFELFRIMDE